MWASSISRYIGWTVFVLAILVSGLCISRGENPPVGTFTTILLALLLATAGEIGAAIGRLAKQD